MHKIYKNAFQTALWKFQVCQINTLDQVEFQPWKSLFRPLKQLKVEAFNSLSNEITRLNEIL